MTVSNPEQALHDQLVAFCDLESEEASRLSQGRFDQTLDQRVDTGLAIRGLRLLDVNAAAGKQRLTFECPSHAAKMRRGDAVYLSWERDNLTADPTAEARRVEIELGVADVSADDRVVLDTADSLDAETLTRCTDEPAVIDLKQLDFWHIITAALEGLPWLTHVSNAWWTRGEQPEPRAPVEALDHPRAHGLDDSQRRAFLTAFHATSGAVLIQGPPGTGKTRVLASLALALAESGNRVGIAAFTNHAVDNVVSAICERQRDTAPVRVARVRGTAGRWPGVTVPRSMAQVADRVAGITCATTHTIVRGIPEMFDVLLLDEASQIAQPIAMAAMMRARRWVFVGDHRQMSPVLLHRGHDPSLAPSLFERFIGTAPATMLEVCRRMPEPLIAFSSARWYGGMVRGDVSLDNAVLTLAPMPDAATWMDQALAPTNHSVVVEVPHRDREQHCPEEAAAAAQIVRRAMQRGVAPRDIVIVTPYRKQEREIRARLRAVAGETAALDVRIETVERIQGQEADVVILSLCSSQPGGSLSDQHLNVAITRCRRKRIVLGAPAILDARNAGGAWAAVAALASSATRVTMTPM